MIKNRDPISMPEAMEHITKEHGAETLAFIKKFTSLKEKDGKEMRKKLEALNNVKLDGKSISKIIELLPENDEELSKVAQGALLDDEESKKVFDIVKEFK